jgi:hypothetical protein
MNVKKDGILITCLSGTFLNLYEIKSKEYKIIQTIKPCGFFIDVIGKISDSFSIQKFIELKNGDIAILVWGYALSFYKKDKKTQKYSYLNKHSENVTDLCEIDDNKYCISLVFNGVIQFLDMDSKKITHTIRCYDFGNSKSKNKLVLMNEKDLFLVGQREIAIIDIINKENIKTIKLKSTDDVTYIYKLTNNVIIIGYLNNYIEQLKYNDTNKELNAISNTIKKNGDFLNEYNVTSITIYNDELIVFPYNNSLDKSSLIIYQLKQK